jgi:hypothetical protein
MNKDLGIILQSNSEEAQVRRALALRPERVILDIPYPKDMQIIDQYAYVRGRVAMYPLFHPVSVTATVLASMITQAMDILETRTIYLAFVTYGHYLQYMQALAKDLGTLNYQLFLCSPASNFLGSESGGLLTIYQLRSLGVAIEPCIVLSDTDDSRKIWRHDLFTDFLRDFDQTQFHVHTVVGDGEYDYQEILDWQRPTFFWSIPTFLQLAKPEKEMPYVAIGRPIQERVSAWYDENFTQIAAKLYPTDEIRIVQFLSHKGIDVVLTTDGLYINEKFLDIELSNFNSVETSSN